MSMDWRSGKQRKLVRRKCKFGLWCSIREGDPVICKECLRLHGINQQNIMDFVEGCEKRKSQLRIDFY